MGYGITSVSAFVIWYGLILVTLMVVSQGDGHEGHDHTPGMVMPPGMSMSPDSPPDSQSNILTSFASSTIGLVAFVFSLFFLH